jgi:VWFA-related protein
MIQVPEGRPSSPAHTSATPYTVFKDLRHCWEAVPFQNSNAESFSASWDLDPCESRDCGTPKRIPMRECRIMGPRRKQLLCGVVLFCAVSSQEQTALQKTQSPPDNKSVQVFLTASGKHDSPVTLAQSELSVSVDKQPAQVNMLRAARSDALLFAVLVDTSNSNAAGAAMIRRAALQLFQSLSINGNRGYLVLFDVSVAISTQPLQVSQVQSVLDAAKFSGGTAVYDAIEQTCIQKLSRSGNPDAPRRVILLISDGEDNQSHVNRTAAEETAEKEGVAVFSLITQSSLVGPRGEQFMKEVSQDTGGWAIADGRKPTDGVAPLLRAIEDQWVLSFVPAQSLDPKLHSLGIKTSQKDIHISAPAHIFLQ